MPTFALGALGFARAHWKLIGLGLLLMALAVQSVRLGNAKNEVERVKIANNELRAELKAISTKKAEQQVETGRNIKEAETIRDKAEGKARKIEQAPTVPGCVTPPEIMGADL